MSLSVRIPRTRARLQPFIKVGALSYDGTKDFKDFSTIPGSYITLGSVQKVAYTNTRDIKHWRMLDVDTGGLIQETYPGLSTYELVLDNLILYNLAQTTFLKSLGYDEEDIANQISPFLLQLSLYRPKDSIPAPGTMNSTASEVRSYTFHGCWAKNNPLSFDINEDDLKMVQTIGITAAGVVIGDSSKL